MCFLPSLESHLFSIWWLITYLPSVSKGQFAGSIQATGCFLTGIILGGKGQREAFSWLVTCIMFLLISAFLAKVICRAGTQVQVMLSRLANIKEMLRWGGTKFC